MIKLYWDFILYGSFYCYYKINISMKISLNYFEDDIYYFLFFFYIANVH